MARRAKKDPDEGENDGRPAANEDKGTPAASGLRGLMQRALDEFGTDTLRFRRGSKRHD